MNARMMKPMSMVMSGNTDKDFAMMMAEHHMSGIDMAKIELKYGKNAALKKIASSIVASQTQERAHLLSLAKSIR